MRSLPEFLVIALLVTITPGPGTATVLRVVARDGRAAALGTILGNSAGVLTWGLLSAAGVSSLIQASQIAYDVLRIGGATVLVVLGARSLAARHRAGRGQEWRARRWRRLDGAGPWAPGPIDLGIGALRVACGYW
jgi:threonine/homoserine/homoserine lactone efflux protein